MGDIYKMNNQSKSISQQEMDYISSFIDDKITTRTGSEIYYLSYGPPKERRPDGPRNVICHLCCVENMVTAADLEGHLNGEMHRTNLQREIAKKGVVRLYQYVYEYENDQPVFFRILPGENIQNLAEWETRFEPAGKKRRMLEYRQTGQKSRPLRSVRKQLQIPEVRGDIFTTYNQSKTITPEEMEYISSFISETITSRTDFDIHYLSYAPPRERRPDGPRNVICHLCRVDNMVTAADLAAHLNGEVHITNLQRDICKNGVVKMYQYVYEYENDEPVFFRILPGENVRYISERWATRFEKADQQMPVTLKKLKKLPESRLRAESALHFSVKYPLLGLDYILHVNNHLIFCILCDGFFEKSVYEHVSGYDHENKYIVKHFPNLLQKAKTLLKIPDEIPKQRLIHYIFRQIYGRIAKKRGRKKIYAVPRKEIKKHVERYKDQTLQRITPFDENTLDYAKMEERLEALVKECHENGDNLGFYPPYLPDLVGEGTPYEAEREIFWKELSKIEESYKLKIPKRTPYGNAKQNELTELKSKYEKYDDLPESHPDYKNEWKAYYIKTCERLKKDGIRIEDYDFERDWFPHWNKCKEEAFRKEWDSIRESLKKSFNIPLHAKSPDIFSDQEDSDSESDSDWAPDGEIIKPEKMVDLLAILRILSALEHYLGSLGPKCLELLGEAIIKEKNNQLNELLINNDNLIYFATVNEKLKGLLLTNSIAAEVVQKVEVLIEDIKDLIGTMEMRSQMVKDRYTFGNDKMELLAANNRINSNQQSNDICKNPFRKNINFLSISIMTKKQPKGNKQSKAKNRPMANMKKNYTNLNSDLQKFNEIVEENIDLNSTKMNFPDIPQTVNIGSRLQFESYQENNPEQQKFHASNPQQFFASIPQQNFQQVATGINRQQDYRQSSGNCSNWSDSKADSQGYFASTDFNDRSKGITVPNYDSEVWDQNHPRIDYNDRNFNISTAETSDWRDPKAEIQRYPEPFHFQAQIDSKAEIQNFEPKHESSPFKNGSDVQYRSHEREIPGAKFHREPNEERSRAESWNRNFPQFENVDRNYRRSETERSDWRGPHVENQRYSESSNFEPKREPSTSKQGSEARYRGYERQASDAEFRRERPDYQRSQEQSRREDRDYRGRTVHRHERNRPMDSRPRSRSRSRGYNNGNVSSRHNSMQSYGNSRQSRRR